MSEKDEMIAEARSSLASMRRIIERYMAADEVTDMENDNARQTQGNLYRDAGALLAEPAPRENDKP